MIKEPTFEAMQRLAVDLEQRYSLPKGLFTVHPDHKLTTCFHEYFWNNDYPKTSSLTSEYVIQQKTKSHIITATEWDNVKGENFIFASLYWEHLTQFLGLKTIVLKLNNVSKMYPDHHYLDVTLHRLGYVTTAAHYYKKEVNLQTIKKLMTGRRDVNQALIDLYLTEDLVSYKLSGFNHNMTCKLYCAGISLTLSIRFDNGIYRITSFGVLDDTDAPLEEPLYFFKDKADVFVESETIVSMNILGKTYHYDFSAKEVFHNDEMLK